MKVCHVLNEINETHFFIQQKKSNKEGTKKSKMLENIEMLILCTSSAKQFKESERLKILKPSIRAQPGSIPVHHPVGRHPRQAGGQGLHSLSCAVWPGGHSSTHRCWSRRRGSEQLRQWVAFPQDEHPAAQP